MLNKPCSCGGSNPSCSRCGGWGYIDEISNSRGPVGQGEMAPPRKRQIKQVKQRSDRGLKKTRKQKKSLPTEVKCILCGLSCLDISKHDCLKR